MMTSSSDRPPIIRVRCEGSEDDGCSSSGTEDPTQIISQIRRYYSQDKRHSAPDIRLTTLMGLGLRRPSTGIREKRLSGPHLPPSPLTLAPGSSSTGVHHHHRASLDDGSFDSFWQGRRWARLQNRRRLSENIHHSSSDMPGGKCWAGLTKPSPPEPTVSWTTQLEFGVRVWV